MSAPRPDRLVVADEADPALVAGGAAAGEGWVPEGHDVRRVVIGSVLSGLVVWVLAGVSLVSGDLLLGVTMLLGGVALAALPWEGIRARVPAGLYAGDLGHGLLLPAYPMRVSTIVAQSMLGVVFVVWPVAAWCGWLPEHSRASNLAVSVLLVAGLVALVRAYAGVLSRRRPARGLLLTPEAVVLGDRSRPARLAWSEVDAVVARWTRTSSGGRRLLRRLGRAPATANRLVVVPVGDVADEPWMPTGLLGVEPRVVLAVCRYYLQHPESRTELVTTAATDRVASLAHDL